MLFAAGVSWPALGSSRGLRRLCEIFVYTATSIGLSAISWSRTACHCQSTTVAARRSTDKASLLVQIGLVGEEVANITQAYDLHYRVGHASSVGIAGFTLGESYSLQDNGGVCCCAGIMQIFEVLHLWLFAALAGQIIDNAPK